MDSVETVWMPDDGTYETYVAAYNYTNNNLGVRTSIVHWGTAFVGDFTQTLGHNDRNELTSSSRTDDTRHTRTYTYDPIGNRTLMTEDAGASEAETDYVRNQLNQYERSDRNGTKRAVLMYTYDDDGNLTRADLAGDMNCDGVVDNFDTDPFILALTSAWHTPPFDTYYAAYPNCDAMRADLNGDGVVNNWDIDPYVASVANEALAVEYVWDAENRLIEAHPARDSYQNGDHRVRFAYDYLGRRVQKIYEVYNGSWSTVYERRYIWAGWLMLMELDGSNNAVRKYTWGLDLAGQNGSLNSLEGTGGIGGLLAMQDASSTENYAYCYDGNGNVGQMVAWAPNYGGTTGGAWDTSPGTLARVVARYEYNPYGNIVGPDTNEDGVFDASDNPGAYADDNPIRFSTKYWDDETDLGYWGYRYYSSRLGRWISRDPIEEEGGPALYAYVSNMALNDVDPIGAEGTYTYTTTSPPCGLWYICPKNVSASDLKQANDVGGAGMDPTSFPGFEVIFDPSSTGFSGGVACGGCCAKNCGNIRLVQVVENTVAANVDTTSEKEKENRRDPNGIPPGGYPGQTKAPNNGVKFDDGPLNTWRVGDNTKWRLEVCAICNTGGADRVLGCVQFEFFDGTKKDGEWVAGSRRPHVPGGTWTSHPEDNTRSCIAKPSNGVGDLYKKGIKKWLENAGKI